jgi:protein SSD1
MRNVVRALAVKSMKRSRYLSSGMVEPEKYHHYALNVPLYTHFTSPIRRYPDIVVHRMLAATLDNGKSMTIDNAIAQRTGKVKQMLTDMLVFVDDLS